MIFVDTSAWYAIEVEDDVNHARAKEFLKRLVSNEYGALVTTDYIVDETLTLLRARRGLRTALNFYGKLNRSSSVRIVWVGEDIFSKALKLFQGSGERRSWSFTDCTSFAFMKELSILDAYAFDEDFTEAGLSSHP